MPDPLEPSGSVSRPPAGGSLILDFKHITLVAVLLAGGAGTSGFLAHSGSAEVAQGLAALQLQMGQLAISLEQIKGELRNEQGNHASFSRNLEDHEARLRLVERSANAHPSK